jgi:hypothetical protein
MMTERAHTGAAAARGQVLAALAEAEWGSVGGSPIDLAPEEEL